MRAPTPREIHNRNVRCAGKSVIRDDHHEAVLDADGARQYKPCGNWSANGTSFCQKHGGSFPPSVIAARRRLLWGAAEIVEILERVARDERTPASDRIKAINSYLDRAGVRGGVDVGIEAPKWQEVLGRMFGSNVEPELDLAPEISIEEDRPTPRKAVSKKARASAKRPKFEGW